ncbi:MAG TPA: thioredoxin family protein [Pyrinomonadaceae bacterium]|jgi:thiol-disulfide isomerase/thioredoxin
MKRIIFITLAILFVIFDASAQTAEVSTQKNGITWEKDFKKAQALAKETGKPMMLDFSASWCEPCQMMEKEFWVLSDVVEAVKPFIAVKVDFDAEKGLVGKYGVAAIPYVVFTDPLGNIITSRRGFSNKKLSELNQIFEEMPKDFSPLKKYYDALELKKDDGTALLQIADAYRNSKMVRLSNEFYQKALKTPEIENDAAKKERVMLTLGINAYNLKAFEQSNEYLEDYLKAFPAEKNRETALALLTVGSAILEKMKNANKYLEKLKAEFPESKYIVAAAKAIEDVKNRK